MKIDISTYIENFRSKFRQTVDLENPWDILGDLENRIVVELGELSKDDYHIENGRAIHKSAHIENGVSIKENTIIGKDCIVKAGAYLRNGVYLSEDVMIGANCEIKQSIIFNGSRIAHLNYVGNSLIGTDVNLEAGAVLANHFNEYANRKIQVVVDDTVLDTMVLKFGSLIGDSCRIGANAVLNPGTILAKGAIVGRLIHVDQLKDRA